MNRNNMQENWFLKSTEFSMTLLHNDISKIRVGVIYASEENVTPNNGLKIMYSNVSTRISIA